MFNLDVGNNETQGCDPNMLRDVNCEFELAAEVVGQDEMQFNRENESNLRGYNVSLRKACEVMAPR